MNAVQIHTSSQMEDDHEYETIDVYTKMNATHTSSHLLSSLPVHTPSSPLPAAGDYVIDSCPAYAATTQGQSLNDKSDENAEVQYEEVNV